MMDQREHENDNARPTARESDARTSSRAASQGGSRTKRIAIIAGVVVVLVAAAFGVWWFAGSGDDFFDLNAQEGQAPYKTPEEMQAELDRIVEEGMFNISIASVIQFDEGTQPGKAYIENVPGNRYAMKAAITLDATGETVYASGGIAPGSYIEDIALARDLAPGEYEATCTFAAFDAETLDEVGKAAAAVKLIVRG